MTTATQKKIDEKAEGLKSALTAMEENDAYREQLSAKAQALRADSALLPWDPEWLVRRGNYYTLITPELAADLLEKRNDNNRPYKRRAIAQYVRDMRAGEWNPDASDIKFDRLGFLQDGQNRLAACVEAGVPFPTLVRTGLDPDAKNHMDQGVRRTTGDTVRMAGTQDPNNVAAAMTMRERYEKTVREHGGKQTVNPRRIPMTHAEAIDYLDAHPSIIAMVKLATEMQKVGPGVPRSVYLAALSMFAESSELMARDFAEKFINGESSGTGDPLLALARYLARAKSPTEMKTKSRNKNQQHLAAFVMAWNAWIQSEKLPTLQVKDSDLLPQPV